MKIIRFIVAAWIVICVAAAWYYIGMDAGLLCAVGESLMAVYAALREEEHHEDR